MYVGLSQGSYGGGFDGAKAFKGSMVNLNMWSRVLTDSEIRSHYGNAKQCNAMTIPSNEEILKWSKITNVLNGNVVARPNEC